MESVFAMAFLVTLLLGTVQVVLVVYSRNIVQAAAHEGVRSVIERGAPDRAATAAARSAVARSAGGLLTELDVEIGSSAIEDDRLMTVRVRGRLRPIGPLPLRLPVTAVAHGVASSDPR